MRVVAGTPQADRVGAVLLDDSPKPLSEVVAADEEAGEVVVVARNPDGTIRSTEGGEVLHETLRGRVRIVWRSEAMTSKAVH